LTLSLEQCYNSSDHEHINATHNVTVAGQQGGWEDSMTTSLHHYGGPGATPAITVRRRGRLNDDIATPRLFTWSSIAAPKEVFGISLNTAYNPQTKNSQNANFTTSP